jgi:hypothetical protein
LGAPGVGFLILRRDAWLKPQPASVDRSGAAIGLSARTLYFYRYPTLVRNVLGDWGDPMTLHVT